MHGSRWNRMHIRLTDMLCDDWNSELPDVDFLVVCCGNKAAAVLDECDRVDGAQMLLVLLDGLFLVDVILDYLLV